MLVAVQEVQDGGEDLIALLLVLPHRSDGTLPDDELSDSSLLEAPPRLSVPLPVACDLRHPEVGVALGHPVVAAAFVTMPEAAIYEDCSGVLRKEDVRRTRQTAYRGPVTQALVPQQMAHEDLRSSIPTPDCSHRPVPVGGAHDIHG